MKLPGTTIVFATALMIALPGQSLGGNSTEWRVERISDAGSVIAIRPSAQGGFVQTGKGWHRAALCGDKVCLKPEPPEPHRKVADNGLADGWIARTSGNGIVSAWYGDPTERYGHAILGDAVEAGALFAEDSDGNRLRLNLPKTAVFEDLAPRLADLDGDGRAEIITIKSFLRRGGSLAVYGREGKRLREVAGTEPIGTPNRWLNIAGIADFDGSGRKDTAIVVTPHIGGTLEFWSFGTAGLNRIAAMPGFSNHAIGSRNLDLSVAADADGDGLADLALPDAARRALRIVTLRAAGIVNLATVKLPGEITHNMTWVAGASGPIYLLGLSDGSLVTVRRRP